MGETVFETPWFLQTATTEVGRVNKIVEDRLQRSITELDFKKRKSVAKIERQIDVVKKELKDIRINVDFSSDLHINGLKASDGIHTKEQRRSNSTSKLERKKGKKHKKTKPSESQSAPVSVLAIEKDHQQHLSMGADEKEKVKNENEREQHRSVTKEKHPEKHRTLKILKERSSLYKFDKEKDRRTPGKRKTKKRKHPLDRPHTEMNGFLPAIFREQTAVEYYTEKNNQSEQPQLMSSSELKLIAIVRQANRSSTPKLRRTASFNPKARKHYAFNILDT